MNLKPLKMLLGSLVCCSSLFAQDDVEGWYPEEAQNTPESIFLAFSVMAGLVAIIFLLRRLTDRRRYSDRYYRIGLHELETGSIGYRRSSVHTPQFTLVANWDCLRVIAVLLSFVIAALIYQAWSPWINAEWLVN